MRRHPQCNGTRTGEGITQDGEGDTEGKGPPGGSPPTPLSTPWDTLSRVTPGVVSGSDFRFPAITSEPTIRGQQSFSLKSQTVDTSDLVGHVVSVTTTQLAVVPTEPQTTCKEADVKYIFQ